jgi:putative peptidoglycan lipid II flippase
VLGSVAGTLTMATLQGFQLSRLLHGIDGRRTLTAMLKMLVAAGFLAVTSFLVWYGLDKALGRSFIAQVISLGTAIAAGIAVYVVAAVGLRIQEAHQVRSLIVSRFGRSQSGN